MSFEPDLEPAPQNFRDLFTGQALSHLDEIVLSWRSGGHPISWLDDSATFEVWLDEGPAPFFRLLAPADGFPARLEMDVTDATNAGIPHALALRLWAELADIGKEVENDHVPLRVSLGLFSRGDRKVFLAYALTIARQIARPPDIK